MALYEHILLARQDISAQQVDTLVETFKGIIENNGGT
ncbi:MAG: 30S ribosomal protein S6, partial [Bosea sp. (in: a-proteobacteria)]